jgi:hypothetical protein
MPEAKKASPTRSPAEIYDEFFVPALFQPWARVVMDAARIEPDQCVLDVAVNGVLGLRGRRPRRVGLWLESANEKCSLWRTISQRH